MSKKAKTWLVVQAKRKTYGVANSAGEYAVDSVRFVKVAQKRPALDVDQEAIEVELDFPDDYFDTNSPKVVVVVPDNSQSKVPILTGAKVTRGKGPSAAASIINHP